MKKRLFYSFLLVSSLLLIIVIIGIMSNEKEPTTVMPMQMSRDAFSSFAPQNIDELIAGSDHVVLGTVKKVLDNINTDEYLIEIDKQFKGETESNVIYVYEAKGTLSSDQTYVLFLEETDKPYYPHLTYTSLLKEAILLVKGTEIEHHTSLLASEVTLKELEKTLQSSPGNNVILSSDSSGLFPDIDDNSLSLEALIEKSELIAHVAPKDFSEGNKYVRQVTFDIKTVFKSDVEFDVATVPFMMPSSVEMGEEYIIFVQMHDGLFYTVSQENSIIPKSDESKWNEALKTLNEAF